MAALIETRHRRRRAGLQAIAMNAFRRGTTRSDAPDLPQAPYRIMFCSGGRRPLPSQDSSAALLVASEGKHDRFAELAEATLMRANSSYTGIGERGPPGSTGRRWIAYN